MAALLILLVAGSSTFLAWHARQLSIERDRALVAEQQAQTEAETSQSMLEFMESIFDVAQPGDGGGL